MLLESFRPQRREPGDPVDLSHGDLRGIARRDAMLLEFFVMLRRYRFRALVAGGRP